MPEGELQEKGGRYVRYVGVCLELIDLLEIECGGILRVGSDVLN